MKLVRLAALEGHIRAVPASDAVIAAYCDDPGCPHLHLVLVADEVPYTVAVLSCEMVEELDVLAKAIRDGKATLPEGGTQ